MGKRAWAIRSFLFCFICNGVLVAVLLVSKSSFGSLTASMILGWGGLFTLILWLLFLWRGPTDVQIARVQTAARPRPTAEAPLSKIPPRPAPSVQASPEPAIQVLAALQREGRLIDFLQEDLSAYDDGQIGAAVRNIHTGCKQILKEYMEIKPVLEDQEGGTVTVPPGFDANAIRLTGNVKGNPPFRGVLRHRGWQAERVRLPNTQEQKSRWILAPAEVEIEG
jgi:hypothetical protein